jgi:hypothetical protein
MEGMCIGAGLSHAFLVGYETLMLLCWIGAWCFAALAIRERVKAKM